MRPRGGWRNWAGNQVSRPYAVERPRSVEDVALVVKRAAGEGRRVKAVGSGHSFTAAACTDGVLVDVGALSGVLAADRVTGLVTVGAGTPLYRLNAELARLGLAMSNLGDIDRQTVAGATSTGTHGTGRGLGGLATQMRGLQLVLASGEVVTCSVDERADLFAAARVGLGALGVVTAVTLQCEPSFRLHAQEQPMPLGDVLEALDELVDGNEHFEFFWFPRTDVALTKRNNRLAEGEPARPVGAFRGWIEDELLGNVVFGASCALGRRVPALVPRLNGIAAAALAGRDYADRSDVVFTSPRRVRFVEMEYAVPRAAFRDAFAAVRATAEREQRPVSFPVEVRFAAGDDIPLSTAEGRETAYLAVHRYRGEPFESYFRAVEAALRELGGRPHWGKLHWRTADDLEPAYPRFREFCAVRDAVDPDRVFGNDYLEQVLGR